jgi:HEAT repeat protein
MQRTKAECRSRPASGLRVLALVAGVLAIGGCRVAAPAAAPAPAPPSVLQLTEQQQARYSTAEAQLRSADMDVRRQAAVALLSMDYPPAFNSVLNNLTSSPEPGMRSSMIQAAAFCVEHRCFEAILGAVGDRDPEVRKEAAAALPRFTHPEEVDSVVALANRGDTTVEQRCLLFRALGAGCAVRAVPVLLDGLKAGNRETRLAAYEALGAISRRDLPMDVAQWQEWWASNAHRTREDILSEHCQALARQLDACRAQVAAVTEEKQELIRLISSDSGQAPQSLLAALDSHSESVRLYASVRLAALAPQVVGALELDDRDYKTVKGALDDGLPEVRRNVVRFAAALPGARREELVRKALSDEDPGVLTAAVAATRSGTGPDAASRLATLLTTSRHAVVRVEAANVLGKVGSQESLPALLTALDDTEENVRWFAVEGLRKLGAGQAVPRISELLVKDDSERVRQIAADTLGDLGQPAGAVALSEALSDRNEKVREKAADSLMRLATNDADRMAVIADKFSRRGMPDRAREVLRRVVEQFGQNREAAGQVAGAYRALARLEDEQGNLPAAADAYEKLDAFTGGDLNARRELVRCWVRSGQVARVEPAVKGWLAAANATGQGAVLALAVDAAEMMIDAGGTADASAMLDMAQGAGSSALDRSVALKLERLRRRLTAGQPPQT